MSWLKDRFQELSAQVNMRDGNRTASTVRAARKTQPAQTKKYTGNPDNQPGFQITNNSLTRGLSRGYDQANTLDNNRTWKQRSPDTQVKSALQQVQGNSAVKSVIAGPTQLGRSLGYGYGSDIKDAQTAQTSAQNSQTELMKRAGQRLQDPTVNPAERQRWSDFVTKQQGNTAQINKGAMNLNAEQYKETNPVKTGAAFADTAFTGLTAGMGTTGYQAVKQAGIQGAKQAGKWGATKAVTGTLAGQSAKTAALSAPSGFTGTYAVNPNATAKEAGINTLTAGAFGAALPVATTGLVTAGKALPKVASTTTNLVKKPITRTGLTPDAMNQRGALMEAYTRSKQAGKEVSANQYAKQIQAIDNSTKSPIVKGIRQVLDTNRMLKENQGGFAKLGSDPSYRSAHQIDATTSKNLGGLSNIDDIVGQVKSKYGLTNYDQKDIRNLQKIIGNPEADVKIYRASPKNEINSGDWVTTSKEYANDIKRQNGGKVYEHTVKAKDLNLPANIEDNPSLARFSAFQYAKTDKPKFGLTPLKNNQAGFVKVGKGETLSPQAQKVYDSAQNMSDAQIADTVRGLAGYENTPAYQALKKLADERVKPDPASKMIVGSKEWNDYRTKATAKQDAESALKATEQATKRNDLQGFTDNKSSLQIGKIAKTLDGQIRYNGTVMPKRDYIQQLLKEGATFKDGVLTNLDGSMPRISKTEQDYAKHLYGKQPLGETTQNNQFILPGGKTPTPTQTKLNKQLTDLNNQSLEAFDKGDKLKGLLLTDKKNQLLAKSKGETYTRSPNLEAQIKDATSSQKSTVDQTKVNQPEARPMQSASRPVQAQQPLPQERPLASQLSKKSDVVSKSSPISSDNTPAAVSSKEWGDMMLQADTELPTFNAVAGSKGSSKAKKLVDAINEDNQVTQAAKQAQNTGKEINFYAKKDANGRSIGIERFDPKQHRIEAGFVIDKDGNVVGNHIKVDETGIQVNVGGDLVNMERIVGNPLEWKGKYRVSETMSRNIDSNAPNKEIAQQAKDFIVGSKVKSEANFRKELEVEYNNLGGRIKTVETARPRNINKKQYDDDIFSVLNGDKKDIEIRANYDKPTADAMLTYKKETRKLYDSLITRINAERVKFGQAPINPRKDYITHLQEMNGDKSFTGEVANSIKNSFADEGTQTTRNGVPGQIAGRTENFQPRSAWNKFLQPRTGEKSLRDPYMAVQEYLEPALYNIHMTEATVRARAVEAAFRTAGELQAMTPDSVTKQANQLLNPYKTSTENGKLVAGLQEYANALGKKTQRWDRQIIDASDATALGLKGWQKLQKIGGQGTILGNASSVLAQPLNQAIGLADAGPVNWMKGLTRSARGDKTINQSPFFNARRTQAVKPIRGKGEKTLDAGGVPLRKVELASIEVIWNSQHSKALQAGHKGTKAIQQADYNTERLVGGRGIADRPELYRSTTTNGLLQYTLEVMAQHKAIWKDLSPSQKATFVVTAYGMNYLWENVTGFQPLPDFLGAAIETGKDIADEEDERSTASKLVGGGQRMAGEYVSMNPAASATANIFLDQQDRKKLFGEDSSVGQFEGTAAPVKVVQNAFSAGSNALQGNFKAARNDALKTVPFGNQARKTITGAEMINNGYAVDASGNPTYASPSSLLGKAQALAFGPSSTKEARDYYNNNQTNITGKNDVNTIKASANPSQTVKDIQARRLQEKTGKVVDGATLTPKAQIAQAFGTPEGKKFLAMNEDEKKNHEYYTQYKAMQTGLKTEANKDDRPANYDTLSKGTKSVYDEQINLTKEGKEKWLKAKVNSKTAEAYRAINSMKPAGFPDLPNNNKVATILASYESKSGEWNNTQKNIEKNKALREAYGSELDDNDKWMLDASTAQTQQAIDNGDLSIEKLKQLVAYDNLSIQLGGSAKISKALRAKYGLGYAPSTSGGGSGRSGGSRKKASKYDYTKNLFDSGTSSSDVSKSLRSILEKAMAG